MEMPAVLSPSWLAALLALSGDIEENPGPNKHSPTQYICLLCNKKITHNQTSFRCNNKDTHWIHKKCTNINTSTYSSTWKCNLHTNHINNTNETDTEIRNLNKNTTNTKIENNKLNHTKSQTGIQTPPNERTLKIIQININGITNKITELTKLIEDTKTDIITIQESKLTQKTKTPNINNFTAIRKDRIHNKGGGLLTYIKNNITFTETTIPNNINPHNTELQIIKIHLSHKKTIHIANLYIHPKNTTTLYQLNEDTDITNCFNHITSLSNTIITGDINAHSSAWYCKSNDHRGKLIKELILNSNHIILNTNCHTRLPLSNNQQPTSPDITTITPDLHTRTTWQTINTLSSDHIPILITINTKTNFKLKQHRNTYTNYNKANWTKFTKDIEDIILTSPKPENVNTANKILTNAILLADKINIPKGRIKNTNINQILPKEILEKINTRNETRKQNPKNQILKELNYEITKLIQIHKSNIWKEKIEQNWNHKNNTQIFWNTIQNLSNKRPKQEKNRTIKFNKIKITSKEIAESFNKQFINTIKYSTDKHNRIIDKYTKKQRNTNITITSEEVKKAIANTKNNNSSGPDNINIKHLKHLGPIAIQYLTDTYNISLNNNTIPSIWKLSKIIPIPKPNKDLNLGSSYRPISLLSPIAKTLEKIILPYITQNIQNIKHQHGFKTNYSTSTALHNINNTITQGFNQKRPPKRTIMVALDMSKAFDTVNIHKLIHKIHLTNIPNTIQKYISNYIKGRKAYTLYNNTKSKQQQIKTGVPQGGVLSPTLFNIYLSDIPIPPEDIKLNTYADDITTLSTHINLQTAQKNLQPYLNKLHKWTYDNNLLLNPDKSTATLFTPDPAEYSTTLNLHINNIQIPTIKNPKVLGLTFDPKLTYNEHIKNIKQKADKTINIIKALTSTKWGKQKETLITTYKTITRPIIEYANTIWSPITSDTNINKLQTTQNIALRIATGCTKDTNQQHLHEETLILPLIIHLELHANQYLQKTQSQTHPLHQLNTLTKPHRNLKQTIFNNKSNYNQYIDSKNYTTDETEIKQNIKQIHTKIVEKYLINRNPNKIINKPAPNINTSEEKLPRNIRRTLAQLRTGKSPFLQSYKHKLDPHTHPSPQCPLCKRTEHTTQHLFTCNIIKTHLTPLDLWNDPVGVAELLHVWEGLLVST